MPSGRQRNQLWWLWILPDQQASFGMRLQAQSTCAQRLIAVPRSFMYVPSKIQNGALKYKTCASRIFDRATSAPRFSFSANVMASGIVLHGLAVPRAGGVLFIFF